MVIPRKDDNMVKLLSIIVGGFFGRIGGTTSQSFRCFWNPVQIILVRSNGWFTTKPWWYTLEMLYYLVFQWGMIQAFSYGLNSPIHKLIVKLIGKGGDGSCKLVEWLTRLICAMLWCLPSVFFIKWGSINNWIAFYIIGITLIPLIGTYVKNAKWSEWLVWGMFTTQVLI